MTEKKVKNQWITQDKKRTLFWIAVEDHLGHLDDSHAAAHAACAVDTLKDFEGSLDDAIALVVEFAAADTEHRKRAALAGIKTLSVTYERKFNLGDYNSLHIGMTTWADVHDDTTAEEVQAELWKWIKEAVKEQTLPVINAAKIPTKQTKAPTTTKPPAPARPTSPPPPAGARLPVRTQTGTGAPGNAPPPPPAGHSHPVAPALPPTGNGQSQGGVIQIEFVRITAPKGKPVVEFWRPSRKYAEIRWSLGGEKLMAIAPTLAAAGWVAAHFDTVGEEYKLAVNVYWVPSQCGKYKDITKVETK